MKKDKEKTKVIFRKAYFRDDKEWDVIAFFPGQTAKFGYIADYMHVGQHGESSIEFYWMTKKCSPKEYAPLKRELEKFFGYNFQVVQRLTYKDRIAAWKWKQEN